jgi:hypothetical protein
LSNLHAQEISKILVGKELSKGQEENFYRNSTEGTVPRTDFTITGSAILAPPFFQTA